MPLTVRELVVRATVASRAAEAEERQTGASAPSQDVDRVVEECVEHVLEILRREEER